jgi:hypothetical protein
MGGKWNPTPEQRAAYNATRRERWANDAEHREKKILTSKSWKMSNPEMVRAYKAKPDQRAAENARRRKNYAASDDRERYFARNLRRYGITPADYRRMNHAYPVFTQGRER